MEFPSAVDAALEKDFSKVCWVFLSPAPPLSAEEQLVKDTLIMGTRQTRQVDHHPISQYWSLLTSGGGLGAKLASLMGAVPMGEANQGRAPCMAISVRPNQLADRKQTHLLVQWLPYPTSNQLSPDEARKLEEDDLVCPSTCQLKVPGWSVQQPDGAQSYPKGDLVERHGPATKEIAELAGNINILVKQRYLQVKQRLLARGTLGATQTLSPATTISSGQTELVPNTPILASSPPLLASSLTEIEKQPRESGLALDSAPARIGSSSPTGRKTPFGYTLAMASLWGAAGGFVLVSGMLWGLNATPGIGIDAQGSNLYARGAFTANVLAMPLIAFAIPVTVFYVKDRQGIKQ